MGTNKTLYGIMAFAPIVLTVFGVAGFILAAASAPRYGGGDEVAGLFIFMLLLILVASALSLASLIMYIIHISKNRSLDDGSRIGWIVGMIFANGITQIVYFFVHIVNEQPLPPSEPFGNPKNPW
ncbi:MAG: hypothetical protein U0176_14105 [Bacteroidia bacterium]